MNGDAQVEALARYFEQLTPQDLPRLADHYAEGAFFKDPFNEVRGVPAITRIFAHMFEQLDAPRFVVLERLQQGRQGFLTWRLDYRPRGQRGGPLRSIRGASHVEFDAQGRVTLHRDYWDAAEELYETLPVLGAVMRWLRRRLATNG